MTSATQGEQQVVDVAELMSDETFPRGSRAKRVFVVAPDPRYPFLRGAHRYIFKESMERAPVQFWSEIVAYEVSRQVGIEVPPAFVAVDSSRGVCGALIEYFMQYPGGDVTERLVHAVDLLVRVQPEFDRIKGRQHNLTTNLSLTSFLERRAGLSGGIDFWSRAIVFDALIGNTDRHPENWGIIWQGYGSGARCRLSPAYDNGTSLGYEFADDRLAALDDAWITRYIDRGTHHMRLRHDSPRRAGHFQLCADFAQLHPSAVPKMRGCLQIDFERLTGRLDSLTCFDVPVRLAPERRDFMLRLLQARQQRIESAIAAVSAQ